MQVGRTAAAVGPHAGRHLLDSHAKQRGFHDHLAGELHSGGTQVHDFISSLREGAQAAVEVSAWSFEKKASDPGEHRIAEVPMQRPHGTGFDTTKEPVAHDEVTSLAQLFEEPRHIPKIVAAIGVAHDNELTAGGGDTTHQCAAITLAWDVNHADTQSFGDLRRAILTAVVRNDDFPLQVVGAEHRLHLSNADSQRLRLVQAGNNDRHLRVIIIARMLTQSRFFRRNSRPDCQPASPSQTRVQGIRILPWIM